MGKLSARRRRRRRRRRHLEIQVDIQARKLFLEFSNWILTHMRDVRILRLGFYIKFELVLSSMWSHFWNKIHKKLFGSCLNIEDVIFGKTNSKMASTPNVTGGAWGVGKGSCIKMLIVLNKFVRK